MLLLHWKSALATALCVACSEPGLAQLAPSITLQVDVEAFVVYTYDVTDSSKFATDQSRTTSSLGLQQGGLRTFTPFIGIADIIAVNDTPAKGTWVTRGIVLNLQTRALPGQAIADTIRTNMTDQAFEILQADGTPIGTIMASEVGFGAPPPGAPLTSVGNNKTITGGTGAFLGVRGQIGLSQTAGIRIASVSEDPANRRMHGGGTSRHLIQLIPSSRPEIVSTATGPAIFHADFSPVTAAKPASTGEVLIVRATGLGPTRPGVDSGRPFPSDALHQVNSTIAIFVNGQQAEVSAAIGWPGLVDTYRVDFRVPDGTTAGMAGIQLSVAWITGASVSIPIQQETASQFNWRRAGGQANNARCWRPHLQGHYGWITAYPKIDSSEAGSGLLLPDAAAFRNSQSLSYVALHRFRASLRPWENLL